MSDEGFISRWSRKKTEAKAATPKVDTQPATPASGHVAGAAAQPAPSGIEPEAEARFPEPLPAVESLTPDSDFAPFMKPGVDAHTRRAAMKVLLRDPRFNVMDGLDVYIDDYSKPDPLPEGWLEKMTQTARLGEYQDPDRTPPEPDAENAEKTAREDRDAVEARAENDVREQALAQPNALPAADTPAEGSPDAEVKESPRPG